MTATTPTAVKCDYCFGPVVGAGLCGRPSPHHDAARYCCYGCLSLGEQRPASRSSPRRFNWFAFRIGLSLVIIAQSMILSLGIALEEQSASDVKFAVYGSVLLGCLLTMVLLGLPLVQAAWRELSHGLITIESLFLLTMAGAFTASMQSFITGQGPIYFEVVSVILVVYSLGKAIMAKAKQSAIQQTQSWADSLAMCHYVVGDTVTERPVAELQVGDSVDVHPGELIPIDGVIIHGEGTISEAAMTGEPFGQVRRVGDYVVAGAISHDALFRIQATTLGSERHVDQLIRVINEATELPTATQSLINQISLRIFPVLILIAVATFAYWSWTASWAVGSFHAMCVLLVACPCALGLATPVVVWNTLARLAERGFVARSGDVIEQLATIRTVMFDKTGTLTEERLTLTDIAIVPGQHRPTILGWLAAVQAHSSHPIAKAFREIPPPTDVTISECRQHAGLGIEATIHTAGQTHHLRIGHSSWLNTTEAETTALEQQLIATTGQRILATLDDRLLAVIVINERLRDSVPQALTQLANLGINVTILTGDREPQPTIRELSPVLAGLMPLEKLAQIEQQQHVMMVGDGINDAAAMAKATVGVAMHTGSDLAVQSAAVTLYHPDLRVIPWAIAMGREAQAIIRQNLWLAGGYNVVGVTLAAAGILHPVVAALLMVCSSVYVAWSAGRVGVSAEAACHQPTNRRSQLAWDVPFCHAMSVWLQGLLLVELMGLADSRAVSIIFLFGVGGSIAAVWWYRQPTLSHHVDMAFGMLTFGNMGMLFGWWADAGFQPLKYGHCDCAASLFAGEFKPWMWLGMLICGTIAMVWLGRTEHGSPRHWYCMLTGGNLGMAIGMLAGGWLCRDLFGPEIRLNILLSIAGMTIGMIVGMFAGTALLEQSIQKYRRISRKLCANQ